MSYLSYCFIERTAHRELAKKWFLYVCARVCFKVCAMQVFTGAVYVYINIKEAKMQLVGVK